MQGLLQEGASREEIDVSTNLEERLVAQLLIISHSVVTDASRLVEGMQAKEAETQRLAIILIASLMIGLVITVITSSLVIARNISSSKCRPWRQALANSY